MSELHNKVKTRYDISVVCIPFGSSDFLKDLLSSLGNQNVYQLNIEIIFVLYNQPLIYEIEGIIKSFSTRFKNKYAVKILKAGSNKGFATGVNLGANESKGELLILMNPDISFSDRLLLVKTYKLTNSDSNLILGAITHSFEGTRHFSFRRAPSLGVFLFEFTNLKKIWLNNPFSRKFNFYDYTNNVNYLEVDSVSGSFLAIKREDFLLLGGMDERFFLYLEDLDFCLRAKRKGFKIRVYTKLRINHFGGGSSRSKKGKVRIEHWVQSRNLFVKKWVDSIVVMKVLLILFWIDTLLIKFLGLFRKRKQK